MDGVLYLIFGRTVQLGDLRVVEGAVAALRRRGDGDPDEFSVLVGDRAFVELDALEEPPLQLQRRVRDHLEHARHESEHLLYLPVDFLTVHLSRLSTTRPRLQR